LQSDDEVKEYIGEYLGTSAAAREFADGFVVRKAFEGGASTAQPQHQQQQQSEEKERKQRGRRDGRK